MSSPRRVAKDALQRAAKAASRQRPASKSAGDAAADAKRLAAAIEHGIVEGRLDLLPAGALQTLIAAACRLYTARCEAGEDLAPVAKKSISATDAMVTASGLLRAADLAVFELGLWQGWTGR